MLYKNYKKLIIFTLIISVLFFLFINLDAINADEYGLADTAKEAGGLIDPETRPLPVIIGEIIGAVLSFIGVLFLLLTIYGGITWMFAQGNEQQVDKAKQIIIAAVIGLIIVLSAYAITAFVGQALLAGI